MTIEQLEDKIIQAKWKAENGGCGWLGRSEKQNTQINLLESILRVIQGFDKEILIR